MVMTKPTFVRALRLALYGCALFHPSYAFTQRSTDGNCWRIGARGRRLVVRPSTASSNNAENWKEDNKNDAIKKAQDMKNRAKELLAEANALEATVKDEKSSKTKKNLRERNNLIEVLFTSNSTPNRLAEQIRQRNLTPKQLILVVEGLHERLVLAQGRGSRSAKASKEFQIGDVRNSAQVDTFESERLDKWINMLIEAAGMLDDESVGRNSTLFRWTGRVRGTLKSHLGGLRQADEDALLRRLQAEEVDMQEYIRKSFGLTSMPSEVDQSPNISRAVENIAKIPRWIPPTLLPSILSCKDNLDPADVITIRDKVLPYTEFFVTQSEINSPLKKASLFRGTVRSKSGVDDRNLTAVMFQNVQERMEQEEGLSDRVQLFLVEDTRDAPLSPSQPPRPMILAVP